MARVYWHAGSPLNAAEFKAEQAYADSLQSCQDKAHGDSAPNGAGVIGSRVRAVDGSVEFSLEPADALVPLRRDPKRPPCGDHGSFRWDAEFLR